MIRETASSMRLIGIRPARTSSIVAAMNFFQSSGTITRSIPALIACGQCQLVQPGTCPIAVPVADDEAVEAEPVLQDVADEMGVAVHLAPAACRSRCR